MSANQREIDLSPTPAEVAAAAEAAEIDRLIMQAEEEAASYTLGYKPPVVMCEIPITSTASLSVSLEFVEQNIARAEATLAMWRELRQEVIKRLTLQPGVKKLRAKRIRR